MWKICQVALLFICLIKIPSLEIAFHAQTIPFSLVIEFFGSLPLLVRPSSAVSIL